MRPVDADELVMFPYSEGSGTEEQITEWIEQAGLSEDDTADRARELCCMVIEGCVNVVKTQPTLTPQNEPLTIEQLREMDGEPVYLVAQKYGISEWNVLNGMDEIVLAYDEPVVGMKAVVPGIKFINGRVLGVGSYGEDWLAYRRPPERQEDT